MSQRQNDDLHHMDRDAYKLFSRGLFLMLAGVLMSVLALLFLPYMTSLGWLAVVLGGVAVAVLLVFWPGGGVEADLADDNRREVIGE